MEEIKVRLLDAIKDNDLTDVTAILWEMNDKELRDTWAQLNDVCRLANSVLLIRTKDGGK